MSKKKKAMIISAAIIFAILVVVYCIAMIMFNHYYGLIQYTDSNIGDPSLTESELASIDEQNTESEFLVEPVTDEEEKTIEQQLAENLERMQNTELMQDNVMNILLIGVDSQKDNYKGRSDVMILLSINKATNKLVMTSFLRDTYVTIPGYQSNRLNAAYAIGGSNLLCETIQGNYGIRVDRCVVVNWYVTVDFVDAVGGVDIELDSSEIEEINKLTGYHIKLCCPDLNPNDCLIDEKDAIGTKNGKKIYHLNGVQALSHSRNRHSDNDFGRTSRQREVLSEAINKVKTMSLLEISDLANIFLPKIVTNLTESDCAYLLLQAVQLNKYTVEQVSLPIKGSWRYATIRKMAVITVDFKKNRDAWYLAVTGDYASNEIENRPQSATAVYGEDESFFDDAIFIGDSRMHGLQLYAPLGRADYFAIDGLGIGGLFTSSIGGVKLEEMLSEIQYGKIFIMMGINNVHASATSITASFKDKLERIRELQPKSEICVFAVLGTSKERAEYDESFLSSNIETINDGIQIVCEENGYILINPNALFTDDDGYLLADCTSDGLHFNKRFYHDLAVWICNNAGTLY